MREQPRLPAFRFALALGFALAFGVAAALAEDYPVRPVRIIIGFGPGASGDIAARIDGRPGGGRA